MERRRLGRTDMDASVLGFGGSEIGYDGIPARTVTALLNGAIDAGLSMWTHLGNGCPMQMHRHDNVVQRVLSVCDRLYPMFIADGAHVAFPALKNYLKLAGDRAIVVTDATAPAGGGPGRGPSRGRVQDRQQSQDPRTQRVGRTEPDEDGIGRVGFHDVGGPRLPLLVELGKAVGQIHLMSSPQDLGPPRGRTGTALQHRHERLAPVERGIEGREISDLQSDDDQTRCGREEIQACDVRSDSALEPQR